MQLFKTVGFILQAINLAIQSIARLTVSISEGTEECVDMGRDEIGVDGEGQRVQHVLDRRAVRAELKGHKFTKDEHGYIYRSRSRVPLLS